jgi:hypothetical protein
MAKMAVSESNAGKQIAKNTDKLSLIFVMKLMQTVYGLNQIAKLILH